MRPPPWPQASLSLERIIWNSGCPGPAEDRRPEARGGAISARLALEKLVQGSQGAAGACVRGPPAAVVTVNDC